MLWLVIPLSWLMIVSGIGVFIALMSGQNAKYGRYTEASSLSVPASLAWFIQESPAFFIPFYYILQSESYYGSLITLLMLIHYFNRTFIFPFKLNTKNSSPWYIVLSAAIFCIWNGFIQGASNAKLQPTFAESSTFSICLLLVGIVIFFAGMIINQRADAILLNLRKPGETGYKIPTGELYDFITCPNYFGEIIEWIGYAIAAQSLPAAAFAFFTFCNLAPRAITHHKWYHSKFADYPKNRKALIPFVW